VGEDVPFLIAAAVAVIASPVLAAAGKRLGLVDMPGELKIHGSPVPVTGGAAVVVAVFTGTALVGRGDPWIAAAVCLALGGGMVDDARPLPPWVRLVVQVAAGAVLAAGGSRLQPFGALGAPGLILATVACCNAVNMVDGQDGLAAGLGAIAALGIAGVLAASGLEAALPLAVAGALIGFLAWNRPPARVFLGDGGAYAVGVLLTASAAQATAIGWHGLLAAGVCLGVFAYELVATILRRLVSAEPTVRGDRDHSYDRLGVRIGSRTAATVVMWALGTLAALMGIAVSKMQALVALVVIGSVLIATALLDHHLIPVSVPKGER
jgi:UDP-GlcNAc:undecaprenyl-phosphate/decaprenyl-phosphate GlcNAc-1-phosphate transferase